MPRARATSRRKIKKEVHLEVPCRHFPGDGRLDPHVFVGFEEHILVRETCEIMLSFILEALRSARIGAIFVVGRVEFRCGSNKRQRKMDETAVGHDC